VLGIDVDTCAICGGTMRIIEDPLMGDPLLLVTFATETGFRY
jgi:hypothetical protein